MIFARGGRIGYRPKVVQAPHAKERCVGAVEALKGRLAGIDMVRGKYLNFVLSSASMHVHTRKVLLRSSTTDIKKNLSKRVSTQKNLFSCNTCACLGQPEGVGRKSGADSKKKKNKIRKYMGHKKARDVRFMENSSRQTWKKKQAPI
jgi:hypothetical protein